MGNLKSKRDWGHAKDYIEAMYLILQQDKPEDFVIATGQTTEIREFVKMAFAHVGVTLAFKGSGVNEVGYVDEIDKQKFETQTGKACHLTMGQELVFVDPKYFRPTEVDLLIGDPTKSKEKLGWKPKYDLPALVEDMMSSDIRLMQKQDYLKAGGFDTQNYFE